MSWSELIFAAFKRVNASESILPLLTVENRAALIAKLDSKLPVQPARSSYRSQAELQRAVREVVAGKRPAVEALAEAQARVAKVP